MTELPMQRGLLFCLSGPSGVGKGTVIAEVRRRRPQIAHSVSMTTRIARPGEIDGVHYFFKNTEEFRHLLEHGEILEHDNYCGNYYGTPRTPLEAMRDEGRDVLMDITVPGSMAVMKNYSDVVMLFLMPPTLSELRYRLTKRGTECESVVEQRLLKGRSEINKANLFDYVVINDELDATVDRILAIIDAEHCRYERLKGIENFVLSR
ncbi:MAG: guanylate kinase [Eubacteriales bacterium]|nr:guanylate kinase [Eubacteriales bacterium]